MSGFVNKIPGMVSLVLLGLSSYFGVVFFTSWLLPICLVSPAYYRRLMDVMVASWECYAAALLELFLGIKVVTTGDTLRPGERTLMIMNHRTRLDWMYMWSVLIRQSSVKTEKIILKNTLKHVPGAGWAMQCGAYIFIHRKWEMDKLILSKMIKYFADLNHKTQILLFPEGTDLTPQTKASSDRFAEKNGLQSYNYVLHPRTTGFSHIAMEMLQNDMLDCIYDITVAYPYNFPQTEPELVMGNYPAEVHFHIKRHPVANLPTTPEELQSWCQSRWTEKEARLAAFHQHKHFSEHSDDMTSEQNNNERNARPILYSALAYWTLFCFAIILLLIFSPMARIFMLFQTGFYLFVSWRYGGFDFLQVDIFNRLNGHHKDS